MKPNLLLLVTVALLLSISFQEAHALSTDSYDTVSLNFNTARQPSTTERVQVSATVTIDTTISASAQRGRVDLQISQTNFSAENITKSRGGGDIGGLFSSLSTYQSAQLSVIVPAGYYYRLVNVSESGTPTMTIDLVKEILNDKPFTDPINQFDCSDAEPNAKSYCSFTSLFNNFTYRNDLIWNYTVLDSAGATFASGLVTNGSTRGRYRFNFTVPSNEDVLEVQVWNDTIDYSISDMVLVAYRTLTPNQNDTLYGIIGNVTTNITQGLNQTEFDINASINQTEFDLNATINQTEFDLNVSINTTGNNIMINTTAEGNLTRTNVTSQFNTLTASFNILDNYIRIAKQLITDFWSNPDRQLTMFNQSLVNFN